MSRAWVVASLLVMIGMSAEAQGQAQPNPGACLPARAGLPQGDDISGLLARFGTGGGGLSAEVRNIATGNPALIDSVMRLVGSGTPAQRLAIGTGLGAAATICIRGHGETARAIQTAVVVADNADVTRGFEGVAGDILTTANTTGNNAAQNSPVADTGGSGVGGGVGRPRPTEQAGGAVSSTTNLFQAALSAPGVSASSSASPFRP